MSAEMHETVCEVLHKSKRALKVLIQLIVDVQNMKRGDVQRGNVKRGEMKRGHVQFNSANKSAETGNY